MADGSDKYPAEITDAPSINTRMNIECFSAEVIVRKCEKGYGAHAVGPAWIKKMHSGIYI